jgi:uncharacterized protein (DUF1015 family)
MNKETLEILLAIPFGDLTPQNKSELMNYYQFIFNTKICISCKDKFKIYYEKLYKNGIELLADKTSNFKLRTNLGVYSIDMGDGTSISITDAPNDICLRFLKENPNRIEMFESYPDNWTDLIK